MPKSLWRYSVGAATYRFIQNKSQLILFIVSITVFAAVTIMYLLQGTRRTYESLQHSPDCRVACKVLLDAPWFPLFASFPLSVFGNIDYKGYQLQQNPAYQYFLCKSLSVKPQRHVFKFSPPVNVRSIAQQYYRLPRLDFGQPGALPMVVTYGGPGLVYERHHFPTQRQQKVFELTAASSSGASVLFEQLQNVKTVEVQPYDYKNCKVYNKTERLSSHTTIAAQLKRTAPGIPVSPISFNFVRSVKYYEWADFTFWVAMAVSGATLVETLIYFLYACHIKMKGNAREEAWAEHVWLMQQE